MLANKRIAVVLPAYNASKTLRRTFEEIPLGIVDDVLLTDDASSDDTAELARSLGIYTARHDRNRGYGGNQKTCYAAALARGADIVVMLQPDGLGVVRTSVEFRLHRAGLMRSPILSEEDTGRLRPLADAHILA